MTFAVIAVLIVLGIIIAPHVNGSNAEKMVFDVYQNTVRPALGNLGFVGESGYVTEKKELIESLYYLKLFNRLDEESFRLEEWRTPIKTLFNRDDRAPGDNRYDISFQAEQQNGRNQGILSLTLHNDALKEQYSGLGRPLTQVHAPLEYFHETNLNDALGRLFMDIEIVEDGGNLENRWYVMGLPHPAAEYKVLGLPSIETTGDSADERRIQSAVKMMRNGYKN